jgi:hypothetical protein
VIEGALILLVGLVIGRFTPARRRRPKPPKPVEPICGCGHGIHDHDPDTKSCHAQTKAYRYDRIEEREVFNKYVPCTCRQYTGPTPLPEFFATEIGG